MASIQILPIIHNLCKYISEHGGDTAHILNPVLLDDIILLFMFNCYFLSTAATRLTCSPPRSLAGCLPRVSAASCCASRGGGGGGGGGGHPGRRGKGGCSWPACARTQKFSNVLHILTFYSKYNRALTFTRNKNQTAVREKTSSRGPAGRSRGSGGGEQACQSTRRAAMIVVKRVVERVVKMQAWALETLALAKRVVKTWAKPLETVVSRCPLETQALASLIVCGARLCCVGVRGPMSPHVILKLLPWCFRCVCVCVCVCLVCGPMSRMSYTSRCLGVSGACVRACVRACVIFIHIDTHKQTTTYTDAHTRTHTHNVRQQGAKWPWRGTEWQRSATTLSLGFRLV